MLLTAHCWVKISLPQKYTDVKNMYFHFLELPWTKQVRRLARSSLRWNIFLFCFVFVFVLFFQAWLSRLSISWSTQEPTGTKGNYHEFTNKRFLTWRICMEGRSSLLRFLFEFLFIHWLMYKVFAAVVKFELLYSTRMWNDSSPSK